MRIKEQAFPDQNGRKIDEIRVAKSGWYLDRETLNGWGINTAYEYLHGIIESIAQSPPSGKIGIVFFGHLVGSGVPAIFVPVNFTLDFLKPFSKAKESPFRYTLRDCFAEIRPILKIDSTGKIHLYAPPDNSDTAEETQILNSLPAEKQGDIRSYRLVSPGKKRFTRKAPALPGNYLDGIEEISSRSISLEDYCYISSILDDLFLGDWSTRLQYTILMDYEYPSDKDNGKLPFMRRVSLPCFSVQRYEHLEDICKKLGLEVRLDDSLKANEKGWIRVQDVKLDPRKGLMGKPILCVNPDLQPRERLLALAHEIGHFRLHFPLFLAEIVSSRKNLRRFNAYMTYLEYQYEWSESLELQADIYASFIFYNEPAFFDTVYFSENALVYLAERLAGDTNARQIDPLRYQGQRFNELFNGIYFEQGDTPFHQWYRALHWRWNRAEQNLPILIRDNRTFFVMNPMVIAYCLMPFRPPHINRLCWEFTSETMREVEFNRFGLFFEDEIDFESLPCPNYLKAKHIRNAIEFLEEVDDFLNELPTEIWDIETDEYIKEYTSKRLRSKVLSLDARRARAQILHALRGPWRTDESLAVASLIKREILELTITAKRIFFRGREGFGQTIPGTNQVVLFRAALRNPQLAAQIVIHEARHFLQKAGTKENPYQLELEVEAIKWQYGPDYWAECIGDSGGRERINHVFGNTSSVSIDSKQKLDWEMNIIFCPCCKEARNIDFFVHCGLVHELGNIPRYRCKRCEHSFESLPPSFEEYEQANEAGDFEYQSCLPAWSDVAPNFDDLERRIEEVRLELEEDVKGLLQSSQQESDEGSDRPF